MKSLLVLSTPVGTSNVMESQKYCPRPGLIITFLTRSEQFGKITVKLKWTKKTTLKSLL